MTLFTAAGILARSEKGLLYDIELSYFDWLVTQYYSYEDAKKISRKNNSWLRNIPELYSTRAPGNTCLSALKQRLREGVKPESFIESGINNSKGCGGVMRVAPIGFIGGISAEQAGMIAAEASAVTHSHSLGYMPSFVLAYIVKRLYDSGADADLKTVVQESEDAVCRAFPDDPNLEKLTDIIDLAIRLSENDNNDLDNIHQLGEGWVAEETLAIALYCSLRYRNDFAKAIITSVNHKGDSDSTGAVTGNILGALVGYESIDRKWTADLELLDVILKMSDNIYGLSQN